MMRPGPLSSRKLIVRSERKPIVEATQTGDPTLQLVEPILLRSLHLRFAKGLMARDGKALAHQGETEMIAVVHSLQTWVPTVAAHPDSLGIHPLVETEKEG
mmetsp:Transcript_5783/g.21042  ORF Transcript_5783/g.21042 Transcript_5783/m.21042 type:complete len:101 (-) Transcript_5783:1786-2088(-)